MEKGERQKRANQTEMKGDERGKMGGNYCERDRETDGASHDLGLGATSFTCPYFTNRLY